MSQSDPSKSVRLMIQSGIVPKNALQQLINWRLLPEDCAGLSGTKPVSIEKGWDTVKDFVDELGEALSEEDRSVRETQLEHSGGYRKAHLKFSDSSLNITTDVFVDQLGRLILPPEQVYQELTGAIFIDTNGGENLRGICNLEKRYEGSTVSAFVVYLESEGEEP